MATPYTISIKNMSKDQTGIYIFRAPSKYSGGARVFTNAIFQSELQPFASSGSVLTFSFLQQYYAGAQTRVIEPQIGQVSGYTTSAQPIDLAPTSPSGSSANCTNMSINPLGLSKAVSANGVQAGAFRIVTPAFGPEEFFNIGSAVINAATGDPVLSDYIEAQPAKNVDCQPQLTFFVRTGDYKAGTTISFTESSVTAAVCDANEHTDFDVVLNADGTWNISPN